MPPTYSVNFTAPEQAELLETEDEQGALEPGEVAGPTLYSLISPGTELAGGYLGRKFPKSPGYAAVFEVEHIGPGVDGVQMGDRLFCMGPHHSHQCTSLINTVYMPPTVPAEQATFVRLMGVTMATLNTTSARPPAWVLVTGLGPVGHLGAQIFRAGGYRVLAVEPDPRRRGFARQVGIEHVFETVPLDDQRFADKVGLQLECSGHEEAVLDGCRLVAKGGEISLVGAPWKRRSDRYAHELTERIFFDYLIVRSGWEWQIPRHAQPFRQHHTFDNYTAAMEWLGKQRIVVEGLYSLEDPRNAQEVYQDLLHGRAQRPAQIFDWTMLRGQQG